MTSRSLRMLLDSSAPALPGGRAGAGAGRGFARAEAVRPLACDPDRTGRFRSAAACLHVPAAGMWRTAAGSMQILTDRIRQVRLAPAVRQIAPNRQQVAPNRACEVPEGGSEVPRRPPGGSLGRAARPEPVPLPDAGRAPVARHQEGRTRAPSARKAPPAGFGSVGDRAARGDSEPRTRKPAG